MATVEITLRNVRLSATFDDNATSAHVLGMLPLSLDMLDVHGCELVHRFSEPLPVTEVVTSAPRCGDIVYWTPRNALAIFYADCDEAFSDLQIVGRVDDGGELPTSPGDDTVLFTRAEA